MNKQSKKILDADDEQIAAAKHHDPFSILGRDTQGRKTQIKVYMPYAESVQISKDGPNFQRIPDSDFFTCSIASNKLPIHYQLSWVDKEGASHVNYDPYDFPPQLEEFDQHLFGEGKHWHIYKKLGAHQHTIDDVQGILFNVWAPNAQRVSVVGDFNKWDGRCHPMRTLGSSGIWELFIPGLEAGCFYKYEILNRHSHEIVA